MKFQHHLKTDYGLQQISFISFATVILLLLIFTIISAAFTTQPGIKVKMPKAITSNMIKDENVITITSENVVYLNNAVTTLNELETALNHSNMKTRQLLIRANRRTSVGRVMDVWELCRKLNIERINIATNQEN